MPFSMALASPKRQRIMLPFARGAELSVNARLQRIQGQVDPGNVIRADHAIRPPEGPAGR
jgi:hypothetical protein